MSHLDDPREAGRVGPDEPQPAEPAGEAAPGQPGEEEIAETPAETAAVEAAEEPETTVPETTAEGQAEGRGEDAAEPAPAGEDAGEPAAAGDEGAQSPVEPEPFEPEPVERVSQGDVLRGVIRRVQDDGLVVDVGYKADGFVPRSELTLGPGQSPRDLFEEGQAVYVSVLSVDPRDGGLLLSERRARSQRAWADLEQAMAEGRIIKAPVVEAVKGGLIVDVGLRAFMPASHVERGFVKDLNRYVGQAVRARVIEMDRSKGRVILSQKSVLEEEHERRRQETWASLEDGQIRKGIVKGITDFGAFIDLGGVDGLLHVSELAWGRVERPSDVLTEGQEVTVKVLKVDRERERVSLSLKQTQPDPWEGAAARYPEGSWVTGRVVRLAPFGAFVELQPGVEGLVHISEMAERHVAKPEDVVQPGDIVQCRVLRVQEDQRRISLSLKPEPQRRPEIPPAEREGGEGRRSGRRRGRDRRRGGDRERARVELPGREPEGITLGEMFGDLFQQTRQMLVNEQRARGLAADDDGSGEDDDLTPQGAAEPAGDDEAAAARADADVEQPEGEADQGPEGAEDADGTGGSHEVAEGAEAGGEPAEPGRPEDDTQDG
ncbi:MAG: 30S ribosomal protein S1 [Thermaerobacter sp.]